MSLAFLVLSKELLVNDLFFTQIRNVHFILALSTCLHLVQLISKGKSVHSALIVSLLHSFVYSRLKTQD